MVSCLPQNNDWHLHTRFHGTSTKRRHHNHPFKDGIPLHSKGHIGSTARVATKSVQTLRAMTRLLWPPDLKCVAGPPTRSLIRRQVHYGRSTELSKSQEKSVLANSWPSDVAKDISWLYLPLCLICFNVSSEFPYISSVSFLRFLPKFQSHRIHVCYIW